MKKGLLFLFGAALFSAQGFSAEGDPDRVLDKDFMDYIDSSYSVILDQTNRCAGLKGLAGPATEGMWVGPGWGPADYDISHNTTEGSFTITKTMTGLEANWADIRFVATEMKGGNEHNFSHIADKAGDNVDTLTGMFVDMSIDDQTVMNITVTSNVDCELRIDLVDANGRMGNGRLTSAPNSVNESFQNTQRIKCIGGEVHKMQLTWEDPLVDYYTDTFLGEKNGMRHEGERLWAMVDTSADKSAGVALYELPSFIEEKTPVPVSRQAITTISFIIDDNVQAKDNGLAVGDEVIITVSDLSIGYLEEAVEFVAVTDANIEAGLITYDPSKGIRVRGAQDMVFTEKYLGQPENPISTITDPITDPTTITTGIADEATIEVYPNPATDVINVSGVATLTTIGGTVVATGEGSIDVSGVSAGTYFVKTDAGTATVVVK